MNHEALEKLLIGLEMRLKAFAVCEIGRDWRLNVDPLEPVICHCVMQGSGYLELAGRRIPVKAGTLIIVPPGTRKSFSGPDPVAVEISASESCACYPDGLSAFKAHIGEPALVLGCAMIEANCSSCVNLFDGLSEPLVVEMNQPMAANLDALIGEMARPGIGSAVLTRCLITQAIILLLRDQLTQSLDPPILRLLRDQRLTRAMSAMVEHPEHRHSIDSLADVAGMSRSAFIGHFSAEYGRTPCEFLQTVRLRSAARLLLSTELPVKCVAARVGYASRSQFSRAFKLAYGADPSAYRARHVPVAPPSKCTIALDPDVFITDALATRPARCHDLRRETVALQELADRMADDPVDLLPHFVVLAMKLTDAASAGVSIFDHDVAPDIFEWRYLHGSLAPFEKATTPRDDSPCGVTLDVNQPMLLSHPERLYDWIAAENLIIPEVLLVPLSVAGEPLGTLWVVSPEDEHFGQADAQLLSELASFVGIALKMLRAGGALEKALAA
ncbi:MAG TPA: helix-turn-helix domain-containing protein [Sphingomicrobium sp.]|nr:helix-turn-helix domain-containing protein [Sphingomicrobium sp.]